MSARRRLIITIAVLGLIGANDAPTSHASEPSPGRAPVEITATPAGRDLARRAVARHADVGMRVAAADLTVWRVGADAFFVGGRLPDGLESRVARTGDGSRQVQVTYAVGFDGGGRLARGGSEVLAAPAGAAVPSWAFLDAGCFARLGGDGFGFLDACYSLHRLVNETNAKDFYKLEQYGTIGAGIAAKIYSGWMSAAKASSRTSAMSWVDWSPRGNVQGGCQNLTLKVEALGVSFTSPAYFCENNIPTRSEAAGSFRMEWSCGCIYPFGQPYPNSREIDYLQTVSVPNGGSVRWTLSAGYLAR